MVLFAWFSDKTSVLTWYYSDLHRRLQDAYFPERQHRDPLAGVADDVGPLMAIASLTLGDKTGLRETTLPISQISIELYAPITGGLFLGDRFAPQALEVAGMADYTPRRPDTSKPTTRPRSRRGSAEPTPGGND